MDEQRGQDRSEETIDSLEENESLYPSTSLAECFAFDPPIDNETQRQLDADAERRRQKLV